MIITTTNKGKALLSSNYWGSHMEQEGYYYMSPNAGAFRLLCPRGGGLIGEMATAKNVVITLGTVTEAVQTGMIVGKEMLEIMFDDRTADPFCLFASTEQLERYPAAADYGRWWTLTVWEDRHGTPHRCITRKCFLRKSKIPNLKPAPKR